VSTLRTRGTRGARDLWHTYLTWRYTLLFYTLLLTLAVVPLRRALGFPTSLLELFLALNLLAAVLPIRGRQTRRVLLPLLGVAVVGRGGTSWLDQAALVPMALALWTVVALGAAGSALRFALGARGGHREPLYAGLSAYLLAGLFCGVFYWGLAQTWAGSFAIAGDGPQSQFTLPAAIYYSFVTLTTLGYGDIVPRSEVGRGLAILEAVAGQLYLAVMIARLVSLYGAGAGPGQPRETSDGPEGAAR